MLAAYAGWKSAKSRPADVVSGDDLRNVLRAFPGGQMAASPLPSLEVGQIL
jgi:hypothetical protein